MQNLAQEIEQKVEAIEAVSSAEVVVSFQPCSEEYRDLDLVWGILFALLVLGYKIWSPHQFDPNWVVLNVFLAGLVGFLLSRHGKSFRRLLLSSGRAQRWVRRAAESQFYSLGVHQTRERTGLLVYVSRFERAMELVPDVGLVQKLSPELWKSWRRDLGEAEDDLDLIEKLKAQLDQLQGPLERQLPRREDDIDELSNRMVEHL